jgi:hypothetical protein
MNNRTRAALAALAAALLAAVGGVPAAAAPTEEYVPFVTDFPTQEQEYVPFVTDFPRPAAPAPEAHGSPIGIDWSGVPAEAVAATVASALAAAALLVARRRPAGPRLGDC